MTDLEKEISATQWAIAQYSEDDMGKYGVFVDELKTHLDRLMRKIPRAFIQGSF